MRGRAVLTGVYSKGMHSRGRPGLRGWEGGKWCTAMGEQRKRKKGMQSHHTARLRGEEAGAEPWDGGRSKPEDRGRRDTAAGRAGLGAGITGPGGGGRQDQGRGEQGRGGQGAAAAAGPGDGRGPLTCAAELQQPMASAGFCPGGAR